MVQSYRHSICILGNSNLKNHKYRKNQTFLKHTVNCSRKKASAWDAHWVAAVMPKSSKCSTSVLYSCSTHFFLWCPVKRNRVLQSCKKWQIKNGSENNRSPQSTARLSQSVLAQRTRYLLQAQAHEHYKSSGDHSDKPPCFYFHGTRWRRRPARLHKSEIIFEA